MTALLDHALAYAMRDGWTIVPVGGENCKNPGAILRGRWQEQASSDPDVIREWDWSRASGVGVYLPASGLVVVDVDKPDLRGVAEALGVRFDGGLVVQSGRGEGWHAYFQRPADMTAERVGNRVVDGVEIRGNGHQVLPPSRHKTGRLYAWLEHDAEIPTLPPAALAALRNRQTVKPEKTRHGHLLGVGMKAARQAITDEIKRLDVSDGRRFDDPEIRGLAKDGAGYVVADMNGKADAGLLSYVSLDRVRMRSIEWIEKPLWQRRAFHLLAGVKGSGKGTYTALLIAKLTRGLLGEAKSVVIVSSEDSVEVDIKPRLVAAGADLTRCHYVTGTFRLPDDLTKLRKTILAIGDVGLVIIDPVSNHIGGLRTDKEEQVRTAIAPLNELADEFGILVIGIRHVGKDRSRGALASILGSTAWADVPRAVVMIVNDDEDDAVRHVQVVAGNRSATRAGVMFRIDGVMLDGLTEEVTRAVGLGVSAKDIDDLLMPQTRPDSKSRKARELILDILEREAGGMESDALDAAVAKATGVSAKTARNLRGELSKEGLIRSWPEKDESGHPEFWMVGRTGAPR